MIRPWCHENALLEFIAGGSFYEYAIGGGIATIASYVGNAIGDVRSQLIQTLPLAHLQFLSDLDLYYEDADVFVSHAGIDPDRPGSRDERAMLYGHPSVFRMVDKLSKVTVFGHFLQKSKQPFTSGKAICVDSGCGTGGPLTAVLLPELDFIQI